MMELQNKELSEFEIVQRVISGEKALYELIVRRFNPHLYKVGRADNYNHEDTQDLMQDSFVDAYKNLAQFENRSSFKTWIIRIMMNNCYQKREKFSFKNETSQLIHENDLPMFTKSNTDTNAAIHQREIAQIIETALAKIPENYRVVFSLREINELSVVETAYLLGISPTNVKVRLNRAKSMLRDEIEKSYSAKEMFEFNAIYCNAITTRVMNAIDEL